ncbi:hypothetical protein GCM10028805_22340 [Spirosoma harenae]
MKKKQKSANTNQKRKKQRPRLPVSNTAPSNLTKPFYKKIFSAWNVILSTVLACIGLTGYTFFLPKIDLTPIGAFDENDPLVTPIEIKNNSNFSIYNVKSESVLDTLHTDGNNSVKNYHSFVELSKEVRSNEATSFIERMVEIYSNGQAIDYGKIHFNITYTYLYFFHLEDQFHFSFAIGKNRKLIWTRQSKT